MDLQKDSNTYCHILEMSGLFVIDHITSDTRWWQYRTILGFSSCDKFRKNLYGPKGGLGQAYCQAE
ncbi:integrase [Salmonella phage 21]|nr:integrase [Salmonella phage 21]